VRKTLSETQNEFIRATPVAGVLGKSVRVRQATKLYGANAGISNLELDVAPGEFLTLLGPSGSGKTTAMMAIAGFVELDSGEIIIDDTRVDQLPPERRNIGVVFQHLALFSHMSVADNVAFSLRMRGVREGEVQARVRRALELVELPSFGDRLPSQLSGGQQQRVAFARAVVFDPPVLLLDEPLGALDRKLRESMQAELKQLQRRLGITTIMVTHDQEEALTISDRVAVLRDGEIEQIGSPESLYEKPVTPFVADFVGDSNWFEGVIHAIAGDICKVRTKSGSECSGKIRYVDDVDAPLLMLRPERVLLGHEVGNTTNRLSGLIDDVKYVGDSIKYQIRVSVGETLMMKVRNASHRPKLQVGESVIVGWNPDDAIVFLPENSSCSQ
jgi:spermidine/putrescine ABC transporter ATP-binding subunit